MDALRLVLNLVWLIVAGIWLAMAYAIAGIVMCLLVVTIPWGIAAFRIAVFSLWPFGSRIERRPDAGVGSTLGNVIWFVLAGWWLALGHVLTAIGLAVTIVGIPFAWANLKLIPVSLTPLGRDIVDVDDPRSFGVARPAAVGVPAGGPRADAPWYRQ
jgi:uncharacterized membrane protein YccF (DUF307 family)